VKSCVACQSAQFRSCTPIQSSVPGCSSQNLGDCEHACGNSDTADNSAHCGCIEACLARSGACADVTNQYFACETAPCASACGMAACQAYYGGFSSGSKACVACQSAQFRSCVPIQSSAPGCSPQNLGDCEHACGNADGVDNSTHCTCIERCLAGFDACRQVTNQYLTCETAPCAGSCPGL
jgi:hypothetical protein